MKGFYETMLMQLNAQVSRLSRENDILKARAEWKPLTLEEMYMDDVRTQKEIDYAKAIQAKLKEKNT